MCLFICSCILYCSWDNKWTIFHARLSRPPFCFFCHEMLSLARETILPPDSQCWFKDLSILKFCQLPQNWSVLFLCSLVNDYAIILQQQQILYVYLSALGSASELCDWSHHMTGQRGKMSQHSVKIKVPCLPILNTKFGIYIFCLRMEWI